MPSLKLSNLFRRDPTTPSLRERAVELRGALTGQTRRTMMAGTIAATVPLPALALPTPAVEPVPHPDQVLFDAEAECIRTEAAAMTTAEAASAAYTAFRTALGAIPADLLMTPWEAQKFGMVCGGSIVRLPTHCVHHEDRLSPDYAWTAKGLERAINLAPARLGKAGQTPHRIRRWRALLPIAAAYDARHDALKQQFRIRELHGVSDAATKAKNRARADLHRIPATTVEGLAVHTRRLASSAWYDGNTTYTALLLSAAAITGVSLRQSGFDVPAWIAAWEQVGGRIYWYPDSAEWAFVYPPRTKASVETDDAIRLLINEKSSNSAVIDRWLDERKSDPRFARG